MKERVRNLAKELLEHAQEINGVKVAGLQGPRIPEVVKNLAFAIRELSPENTAFVAATADMTGKPLLTVMLTNDVTAHGLNASNIVRAAAKAIKGGGGGQPGFAQAGGKDAEGLAMAYETMMANF